MRLGHGLATLVLGGSLALALALFALLLVALRLPPEAEGSMIAVFEPIVDRQAAFLALVEAGGRPVEPLLGGFVWSVVGEGEGFVGRLEADGALLALSGLPFAAALGGCSGEAAAASPLTAPAY